MSTSQHLVLLYLIRHPRLTVEVRTETFQVDAKVIEEPERTRLYNKMADMLDSFNDYRQKTERVIPVIVLTPVDKYRRLNLKIGSPLI
jgi:hypothetical protein